MKTNTFKKLLKITDTTIMLRTCTHNYVIYVKFTKRHSETETSTETFCCASLNTIMPGFAESYGYGKKIQTNDKTNKIRIF